MAEFDPDAFLASRPAMAPAAAPGFDPDAFLASTPSAVAGSAGLGMLKSLGTGAVQQALQFARGEQIEAEQRAMAFGQPNAGPEIPTGAKANKVLGLHQPTGFPERASATVGGFLVNPATYFGPGGWLSKMLMAGASGIGSEAAGELAEGTPYEPYARMAGSMVAGPLAARAIKPNLAADQQTLANAGITQMTPGQTFPGPAGMFKGVEDAATAIPLLRGFIKGGQRRSIESFNRAVGNQALEPIGEELAASTKAGHPMVGEVEQKLGNAYDSLKSRIAYAPDRDFAADMASIRNRDVAILPQQQIDQFERIIDSRLGPPAPMNGEMFKNIESELNHISTRYLTSSDGAQQGLGDALQDVIGAMRSNLERANPAHADELRRINQGWAMFARIRDAAAQRRASNGVFTPGDLLTAVKRGDRSVRKGAFARGDALMQPFAEAAQRVLPSEIPSSGTTERWLTAGLLGGALPIAPKAVAAGTASVPFYTRPGMWALNRWANPKTTGPLGFIGQGRQAYRTAAEGAVPSVRSIFQAATANPLANPYASPGP